MTTRLTIHIDTPASRGQAQDRMRDILHALEPIGIDISMFEHHKDMTTVWLQDKTKIYDPAELPPEWQPIEPPKAHCLRHKVHKPDCFECLLVVRA